MKAPFASPFAASPASLRRDPTPSELAGGFPCGPLDLQLWDELAYRLSLLNAEGAGLASAAALTLSETDLTQTGQALSRGPWLGTIGQPSNANDLVAALPNSIVWPSLLPGMEFSGVVTAANTGPMTVTMGGFASPPGSLALLGKSGTALAAGDVPASRVRFFYDGSAYRLSESAKSETTSTAVAAVNAARQRIPLTGSGSFTVPAGVTKLYVRCRGGGGGGGGVAASTTAPVAASGGSGGSWAEGWINVTPGQVISYAVGGGGTGGTPTVNGGTGGATTFGAYLTAPGGIGGQFANASTGNTPPTSAPAPGTGGTVNQPGGIGAAGSSVTTTGIGGYGGGSYGISAQNLSGSGQGQGIGGTYPGLGGNGAGTITNGTGYNGGNGAAGELSVEY